MVLDIFRIVVASLRHGCGRFLGLLMVLYGVGMVLACDHIVVVDSAVTCGVVFWKSALI